MVAKDEVASRGSCLLVEDDERLRDALTTAIPALGFSVRAAGTVDGAVAAGWAEAPSFVLLDVALPDGRARDVLKALERCSPHPRVVAMSGAAEPEESFELAALGVSVYLKKPVALSDLERAIERAFNEPP